ncbi:hypothetical protein GOODEAATRI_010869 [Goodea atripinnis]|uniref:Uncharacterized protein n=1 Tax=Goodea atripinnis TaxID=208336 RepID=A0ABV0N0C0_9TELE
MSGLTRLCLIANRRKSQQAEREYEKVKHQLESLEESVRDRCKKEFTDFNARSRGNFASLLTVALHGKLEYYTDIMRTLLLELMDEHDIAGEPLYKLFKALKHQVEKGPVDARLKKAKYTLNDTRLLGDDVEYSVLVLVHGEGPDVTPVKVLNCDTITQVSFSSFQLLIFIVDHRSSCICCLLLHRKGFAGKLHRLPTACRCHVSPPFSQNCLDNGCVYLSMDIYRYDCDFCSIQVKEKIIDQVYRNLPYSQRPKAEGVALGETHGSGLH